MQDAEEQVEALPGDWSNLGSGTWVNSCKRVGNGAFAEVFPAWNPPYTQQAAVTTAVKVGLLLRFTQQSLAVSLMAYGLLFSPPHMHYCHATQLQHL